MDFILTMKRKSDDSPVKSVEFTWSIKADLTTKDTIETGTATTDDNGKLTFTSASVAGSNYVILTTASLKGTFKVIVVRPSQTKVVEVEEEKSKAEVIAQQSAFSDVTTTSYNIEENNKTDWDWIIWETEGNSDPKYQRGGKTRRLGLYKLNYDKLRKAGDKNWKAPDKDHTIGGGWVKVAVLESEDYSAHRELINTFLPCFQIEGRKIKEPAEKAVVSLQAAVGRIVPSGNQPDTLDIKPPFIVLPFNYDDNGEQSRALGNNLTQAVFAKVDAQRLKKDLTRWATASRSTIAAFPKARYPDNVFLEGLGIWNTKNLSSEEIVTPNKWLLRPAKKDAWTDQIPGPANGFSLRTFQSDSVNNETKYYSVKTGVQFVSTQDQTSTSKDLLEENSIHAMNRSNLIKATMKRLSGRFEASYQVEVLCILIKKDPAEEEKAEANPESLINRAPENAAYKQREAHSAALRDGLETLREAFDEPNKEEIRIQVREIEKSNLFPGFNADREIKTLDAAGSEDEFEAKVEDLILKIGAENRVKFNNAEEPIKKIKAKLGFDGVQVREISDGGFKNVWFPALAIPCHGPAFAKHWGKTDDWVTFWKNNFSIPLGRAKGEMLVYFGMQHMTSNAQNFIISFDRQSGSNGGKLNHLILRDIGDTLYNDHFFAVLKDLDPLYQQEWTHESGDPDFGVTLSSNLGSYAMPRMTRIGPSIVFFFGPFIQGEVARSPDCYRILTGWCVSHNRAFLDYMRENIGYSENWGGAGSDTPSQGFLKALARRSNLNKANDLMYQKFVVPEVLTLSSKARWKLINEFEDELRRTPQADSSTKKTVEPKALELVNAHEVLICAEVQSYIVSQAGKAALKKLHSEGPHSAPASANLTLEKFDQLKEGMTYREVVGIIGSEGKDISEESQRKLDVRRYVWEDQSKTLHVVLTDDKLKGKYKANL